MRARLIFAIAGSAELPCQVGQTLSLIQIGDPAEGVTTEGLKWELHSATFSKYFFSLSNICLKNRVKIRVEQGDLLCCMQK